MSHLKSNYNCTQAELYAVCTLGWTNYSNNLTLFTAHKGFYTALFGSTRLAEVVSAQQLPNEQTRDEVVETFRLVLGQKGKTARNKWQDLKSYIETAFPDPFMKPKLEAAGSKFYEQAARGNWEVLKDMMVAGRGFIVANAAALAAGNNMPAGFLASFTLAKAGFETTYTDFLVAEENAVLQTNAKITANNGIYDKLAAMQGDGKKIFRDSPDMANLFTFDYLLGLISPPSPSPTVFAIVPNGFVTIDDVAAGDVLTNRGATLLTFSKTGAPGLSIQVPVGSSVEIPSGMEPSITVHNESATTEGEFSI